MKLETNYRIELCNDSAVNYPIFNKHVPVSIGGNIFLRDLIQFDLLDLLIISGINWLHIDCKDLKAILNDEKGREICFYGKGGETLSLNFCHERK